MIAKAIDKILELYRPALVKAENGHEYSTVSIKRVDSTLRATPITVSTLSSVVDYIALCGDNLKDIPYYIHVVSPTRVELISALDEDRERETIIVAEAETPLIPFGRYLDNETMLITLQSVFVDDPDTDRAALLKFAGTVKSNTVRDYNDDGVTQQATIKHGVSSMAQAIVPSPCKLRPYRTFREIEQPASQFIFRMKDTGSGVESALIEADGGAWRIEAKETIRKYIADRIENCTVMA